MKEEKSFEKIAHLFDEHKLDKQAIEESDKDAKKSTLTMIRLCKVNRLNAKVGVTRLELCERELCRELNQKEVELLFYTMLDAGDFSSLKRAPNDWLSESSSERCCGAQYGKGVDD